MKLIAPQRSRIWLALIAFLTLSLAASLTRQPEPSYKGKTLTQWLYRTNPDTVFMPNDFYGHIHSELWEGVVAGGYAARITEPHQVQAANLKFLPDAATEAIEHMGKDAVPCLVQLMNRKPSPGETFRDAVGPYLPFWLFNVLRQSTMILDTERCHIAACAGFGILGTNAESALPALKQQLEGPRADFELGFGIASIGPRGGDALVDALKSTNGNTRDVAAFSLGEGGSTAELAIPALLNLVERDQASYHVFGAIGRLGGNPDVIVPVVTRYLERTTAKVSAWEPAMAILVLGLFGEKAQPCLPVLAKLYPSTDATTRQVIRMALHQINPGDAERLLNRAWNKTDEEDPWWNGTKE